MAYPHPAAIVEVDDFGRLPEAQHVWRQHSIPVSKCGYRSLPANFGADPELDTMQQDHGLAVDGFPVASDQPVDHDSFAAKLHGGHLSPDRAGRRVWWSSHGPAVRLAAAADSGTDSATFRWSTARRTSGCRRGRQPTARRLPALPSASTAPLLT